MIYIHPDKMREVLGYLGWVVVACFLIVTLAGAIESNKGNSTIENIENVTPAKEAQVNTPAEKAVTKETPVTVGKEIITQEKTTTTDPKDNPAYQARVQKQQEEDLTTSTPGETGEESTTVDTTIDTKYDNNNKEPELPTTVTGLVVDTNGVVYVGQDYAGRTGNFTLV